MNPAPVGRRPARARETGDLVEAVCRLIRRIGHRAATEDVHQLVTLLSIRRVTDEAILDAVTGLRRQGVTWQEIGEATGTTRQAALMKWSMAAAARSLTLPE